MPQIIKVDRFNKNLSIKLELLNIVGGESKYVLVSC